MSMPYDREKNFQRIRDCGWLVLDVIRAKPENRFHRAYDILSAPSETMARIWANADAQFLCSMSQYAKVGEKFGTFVEFEFFQMTRPVQHQIANTAVQMVYSFFQALQDYESASKMGLINWRELPLTAETIRVQTMLHQCGLFDPRELMQAEGVA